jgi:hypothetical protein
LGLVAVSGALRINRNQSALLRLEPPLSICLFGDWGSGMSADTDPPP